MPFRKRPGSTAAIRGMGLAAAVDILSGVLSPGLIMAHGVPPFVSFLEPAADPVGLGIGHFVGAMRIDGFGPAADFKANMDNWIQRFKSASAVTPLQNVIVPG